MTEHRYTRIILRDGRVTSYYSEQETVNYSRVDVQFLRDLQSAGIVKGVDIPGEEQRYSDDDIALLRRANRLYKDLGVNLEGIEIILRLQERLEQLQRELEQYRQ